MKSSVDIVNALAKKLGNVTDYRVAKESGIPQATLSSVRAGRCYLSRENCAKAAEILGVEVGALIAIVTAEREENPSIRASLLRVARKGMAAAAMAAAVGMSAAPAPPAQALGAASSALQQSRALFIMSNSGEPPPKPRGGRRSRASARPTRRDKILPQTVGYEPNLPAVTSKPRPPRRPSETLVTA